MAEDYKERELSEFDVLEAKIEDLLAQCASLKREKLDLTNLLDAKEKEIGELHKEIDGLKEQRVLIGSRINGLLSKLEGVS